MAIEKVEGKVYEYDAIKREETGRLGKASHTQNYALNWIHFFMQFSWIQGNYLPKHWMKESIIPVNEK